MQKFNYNADLHLILLYQKAFMSTNQQPGKEPWSSGYGSRFMFQRSRVWILVLYTGWTFFTFICLKNCNDVCLKRLKINNKRGRGWPIFFKKPSVKEFECVYKVCQCSLPCILVPNSVKNLFPHALNIFGDMRWDFTISIIYLHCVVLKAHFSERNEKGIVYCSSLRVFVWERCERYHIYSLL